MSFERRAGFDEEITTFELFDKHGKAVLKKVPTKLLIMVTYYGQEPPFRHSRIRRAERKFIFFHNGSNRPYANLFKVHLAF